MKFLKKLSISLLLILPLFFISIWEVWAIKVIVTEDLTFLSTEVCTKLAENKYECNVWVWMQWVLVLMWKLIKYFTFLAALGWVLFIVINGIQYSMWWVDQKFKSQSKENIVKTLIWLILLLLSWFILNVIAPWVYK